MLRVPLLMLPLKQVESNAIWFKATDFRVCCVKILVNPKGLTAFYALPTQKSFCEKRCRERKAYVALPLYQSFQISFAILKTAHAFGQPQ